MPTQLLTLTFDRSLNTSVQVGDIAYYSPTSTVAGSGFSTVTTGNIIKIGVINGINNSIGSYSITIVYDSNNITPPGSGDYIMFEKDKRVNSSSLIGYYADINFVNYSTDKIELFSVGSEVSPSSN